jgi:peptidyl-prolyl cis-trans isomerase SurA
VAPVVPDGPLPADEIEPTEASYAATHVLVAFVGAARAPATVTRTEGEARALAVDVYEQAAAGAALEALAHEHSDSPEAQRGGHVGVYRVSTMMPTFERAVAAVAVGEITRPFRTPLGWHVARRDAVVQARARHILVAFDGAWRSASTRTRDEARTRAESALARLAAGEDFGVVAAEIGDDATASVGGDLGVVAPGQLIPAFEDALFALAPGERSGIVETPYGFHIVERTE